MDFELSEQHRILRDTVREFVEREVRPNAKAWDEEERFPIELVPKLAELGLLGVRIPEVYGGAGMDMMAYAICVEECARVDGSLALTIASHNGLGTGHILAFGSEAQKAKYLSKAASGEWLAAWALTEPGSGSDSAALTTTAVRDGNDWLINGTKMFITQGSVGGFCVVLARTNKSVPAQRGISAFIVETTTPGYSASKKLEKYGCRSSDTVEVTLDGVRVSDEQRLGDVDHAFADTMRILDGGRVSIAAMALGLGRGALEMAARYAKDRQAFGVAIAQKQAIAFMLAEMATEIDAARLLTWEAAWKIDRAEDATRESCMAKNYAANMALKVTDNAVQVLGGHGYIRDHLVELFLRNGRGFSVFEGMAMA